VVYARSNKAGAMHRNKPAYASILTCPRTPRQPPFPMRIRQRS